MPGIKELEFFRNELSNLGREREVAEERGEAYVPLPLPSESPSSVPPLDVDNLLASLGAETPEPAAPAGQSDFDQLLANLSLDSSGSPEFDAAPGSDDSSFAVPEDLLAGLSAGIEEDRASADDFAVPDFTDGTEIPEIPEVAEVPEDVVEDVLEEPVEMAELESDTAPTTETGATGDSSAVADDAIAGLDALLAAGLPSLDDIPSTEGESFGVPDLSGFNFPADETGGTAASGNVDDAGDAGGRGFGIPDFSLPEMDSFGASPSAADAPAFDVPAFDAPDFGGRGAAEEAGETAPFEIDITPISDEYAGPTTGTGLDSLGDFDAEAPTQGPAVDGPVAPNPFGDAFSDFSVPDDLSIPAAEGADAAAVDGFDGFSLDEDFLKAGSGAGAEDDFHIPGFSDFTSAQARVSVPEFSFESEGPRKSGKKEVPLKISEEDFRKLFDILAKFPLNVRIAVEEYVSGEEGTELKKMELVHSVLTGVSVRKIARTLEGILDRSIPVPKDFEKKTVAEYELEKSSLRYVFVNRILPIAVMSFVITVLTACTVYLSWQFIYRPLAAEGLYKRGYAAIEDARYTQSTALFDQAVKVWEKKKWYFRYARAYRGKKQYLLAETMYERLLARYDNDLAGGLEYAEMLSLELRNFEKAETVLRRRVLDHHVNNRDGLLLLGDNFLEWADEDPSKYESARATYAVLIELYGDKDLYLSRMMRYFIRIDNLAEVLPLKERLTRRGSGLEPADLVELGGYLLEKRYLPKPGESEALRAAIEDVRALLERAIKVAGTVPEAHYNMGRFFVFNYKNDLASTALSESLRLFETAEPMNPRRMLTRIDAYRLLGEIRAEDMEYLKAGTLYAEGISLYEEQRANRAVRQAPRVGVLYADYADIAYFVSNRLDEALALYERAVAELNDTPSIRYRIGYIRYQGQDYLGAMDAFGIAYARSPADRNLAFGYANALFRRGDVFAAQGHYERLMETLEAERIRKGIIFPQARIDHGEFVELYMKTANNLGVTLSRLSERTGDSRKNARALVLISDAARAWDTLTRNPDTMIRLKPPHDKNLPFMNVRYITKSGEAYSSEIFTDIPRTMENERVLRQRDDR